MNSKIERLLEKAVSFQRGGRLQKSVDLFQQILVIDPNQPDALYHLGVLAYEAGELEKAVQLIVQSLQVNANHAEALNALANVLKDQHRFPEALEFYQAALAILPDAAYLHSNLGLVFNELQRSEEAIVCYQRALALDPKLYAAHSNLGGIFQKQGEWQKALECYEQALALNPKLAVVLANMGAILNDQEKYSEAVHYHEAALKLEPNLDLIHSNLGAAFQKLGQVQEAIDCYRQALKLNPKSQLALSNLGGALWEQNQFDQAVVCLKKALELKPDCFKTWDRLGSALKEQGSLEEGLACFHKALEFTAGQKNDLISPIYRHIAGAHFDAGRAEPSVEWFRKALALKPNCASTFSDLLFVLNHFQQNTVAELFTEHRQFGKQFDSLLEKIPHSNVPEPNRRLRIGFVSGDLRIHAVANFIEPVFTNITKSQFEIFSYANHSVNDAVSERFKAKSDSWCNVDLLSDDQLASQIRNDRIDILVDLSGHTARNRLLVFARKPAPIQVTMIGYMQTTGLAAMDYRITDESLDPTGSTDHLNTEKLIRLPAGASPFQHPLDCPPVNELPALKNGYVTFASFNKSSKITSEVFETWARLLKSLPSSKLLVAGISCDFVAKTMASYGIGPERLVLHERKPIPEYFALHHEADFVLDTFPYNGGTTGLNALWMGLPFVTIEGSTTLSRVGACLLRGSSLSEGSDLSELIATNPDEYVQKAICAVQNLPRLAQWRRELRPGRLAVAGDGSVFTRQLEEVFREIWKTWCEGYAI